MLSERNDIEKYLFDYKNGLIKMGLGIDIEDFDRHLRFKNGQLNMVNGFDNVGKTVWIIWYMLCLSVKHNLTWCIWSGENKPEQLTRQLIEMYSGRKLTSLSEKEIYRYMEEIGQWFTFVSIKESYDNKQLYKIFEKSKCSGALIDPFTGLKREYTHASNYLFLNESREFVNQTGITLYVNTHPHTEAARRTHSEGYFEGYQIPPSKSQSEGGQPFANRVDDFITIHRYLGHKPEHYNTHIFVRKVKDTETGGMVNSMDEPITFHYNDGLGFTHNNFNPLQRKIEEVKPLFANTNFYEKSDEPAPF